MFKYLYTIYVFICFFILFMLCFPFFVLFSFMGSWGRKAIWKTVQVWSYVWSFAIGLPCERIFLGDFDASKPYIVVANHHSYLDTPLIFRAIPFFVRPLAKFELGKIPLFGFLYRQLAVTIDRSSKKSRTEGVLKLKRTLQEGSSILIFPEGTFNETDQPLAPFFDGAFKIAIQNKTPILPVIFLDSNDRWNNKSFWNWSIGKNRILFLPEITVADIDEKDSKTLKDYVANQMSEAILKYKS